MPSKEFCGCAMIILRAAAMMALMALAGSSGMSTTICETTLPPMSATPMVVCDGMDVDGEDAALVVEVQERRVASAGQLAG